MIRFVVFKDLGGRWRWHAKAGNGRIVATSGESFANKSTLDPEGLRPAGLPPLTSVESMLRNPAASDVRDPSAFRVGTPARSSPIIFGLPCDVEAPAQSESPGACMAQTNAAARSAASSAHGSSE